MEIKSNKECLQRKRERGLKMKAGRCRVENFEIKEKERERD